MPSSGPEAKSAAMTLIFTNMSGVADQEHFSWDSRALRGIETL